MPNFDSGHALLIGVGGDLPATIADVTELGAVLRDPGRAGYPAGQVDVLLAEQASREGILGGFARLHENVQRTPNATAIVYYSGHGAEIAPPPPREGPGDGDPARASSQYFLVSHGFESDRAGETGVRGDEFTAAIQAIKARRLVAILDCCHAAGVPRFESTSEAASRDAYPRGIEAELSRGEGRVVLSSCRAGERSYLRPDEALSVFTSCLLEALSGAVADPDGKVNVLELLAYVMKQVPRQHFAQHPYVNRVEELSENFAICLAPTAKRPPEKSGDSSLRTDRRALFARAHKVSRDKVAYLAAVAASLSDGARKFEVEQDLERAEADLERLERRMGIR